MRTTQYFPNKSILDIHYKDNPFKNWEKYNPSQEMEEWRKTYEPIINDAIITKRRVDELLNILQKDVFIFCDQCEEVRCNGAFNPLCEFAVEKILDMLKYKKKDYLKYKHKKMTHSTLSYIENVH
jgi:hypothetical protein